MVHIRLDKNIECEQICKLIQEGINKHLDGQNISDHVLVIKFCPIVHDNDMVLKLENKS